MNTNKTVCYLNMSIQSAAEFYFDENELNFLGGMMHRTMLSKGETGTGKVRTFEFYSAKRQCKVELIVSANEDAPLIQDVQEKRTAGGSSASRNQILSSPHLLWTLRLLPFLRGEIIESMPELLETLSTRLRSVVHWVAQLFK